MSVRSRGSLWTASKPRILMDRYFQEKTNSFRTGEAANSGLSRMQLGFVSLSCRTASVLASLLALPDEMVQPVLALFQEPRPEARHDTLARELRYAAVGVREGFDEVLAKAVELGVSGLRSVGMSLKTCYGIIGRHMRRDRSPCIVVTQCMQAMYQDRMRLPLPDVHIATLESADGTMPDDISADARSTRHNSIIVNSHRTCPACLALLVLFL